VTPRAAVRLAWGLRGLAVALMVAGFAVNPVLGPASLGVPVAPTPLARPSPR
jgi:hypothetical protein